MNTGLNEINLFGHIIIAFDRTTLLLFDAITAEVFYAWFKGEKGWNAIGRWFKEKIKKK